MSAMFKVAFMIPDGDDNFVDGLFDSLRNCLPSGWSCTETGISGAAGFYVAFDVDNLPTKVDCDFVEDLLYSLSCYAPDSMEFKEKVEFAFLEIINNQSMYKVCRWGLFEGETVGRKLMDKTAFLNVKRYLKSKERFRSSDLCQAITDNLLSYYGKNLSITYTKD